jgi:hypothetical protein
MNVYEPMNIKMPSNPYTEEAFRQNLKNTILQIQQSVLTADTQPSATPDLSYSNDSPATPVPVSGNYSEYGNYKNFTKDLSVALARSGVSPEWASGITELVKRESGFNPKAKNPKSTAHGYAQFLDSTRSNYEKKTGLSYDNPVNQLIMMMQYVKDRYGSPDKALNFWNKNNWY